MNTEYQVNQNSAFILDSDKFSPEANISLESVKKNKEDFNKLSDTQMMINENLRDQSYSLDSISSSFLKL